MKKTLMLILISLISFTATPINRIKSIHKIENSTTASISLDLKQSNKCNNPTLFLAPIETITSCQFVSLVLAQEYIDTFDDSDLEYGEIDDVFNLAYYDFLSICLCGG